MEYKEIETQSMGQRKKHIIIDNGDDTFKSFPADESNPEYVAFLAEINGTPLTENLAIENETPELETEEE
jgi:hypothetical protein